MARKDVGVICSMTYYEMKLLTVSLSRIILEHEVRGENTKKRIFTLIGKLNNMLTKQCLN
jgi:hypothetical protein